MVEFGCRIGGKSCKKHTKTVIFVDRCFVAYATLGIAMRPNFKTVKTAFSAGFCGIRHTIECFRTSKVLWALSTTISSKNSCVRIKSSSPDLTTVLGFLRDEVLGKNIQNFVSDLKQWNQFFFWKKSEKMLIVLEVSQITSKRSFLNVSANFIFSIFLFTFSDFRKQIECHLRSFQKI